MCIDDELCESETACKIAISEGCNLDCQISTIILRKEEQRI